MANHKIPPASLIFIFGEAVTSTIGNFLPLF